MPETVDPTTTAYRAVPERSRGSRPTARFRTSGSSSSRAAASRGTSATEGQDRSSAAAPASYYARQNMLSQVGSVTTNGIQQKSDFRDTSFTAFADMPVWPNLLRAERRRRRARSRSSPASASSIATTRIRASTASTPDSSASWRRASAAYVDFTVAKGDAPDAVPELQRPRHRRGGQPAADARHDDLYRRQSVRARSWATCS